MIQTVSRFGELKKHVSGSGMPFREAVVDYYRLLGGRLGFTFMENASVIKHGVNLGKVDLVWVEPNVAFYAEFSNMGELTKHLFKILELGSEWSVLILSSNSSCKPDDARKIVANSAAFEKIRDRVIILDLSKEKIIHPVRGS